MDTKTLRRLHRWTALVFSLAVFLSAGSGLLHLLMARTQPPPPKAAASGGEVALDPAAWKIPLAEGVRVAGFGAEGVSGINLRLIGGEPWYVLRGKGRTVYVHGGDGHVGLDEDAVFAREIAARFLRCAPEEAKAADYLTAYTAEYLNIFRILPVYRFDRGDGRGTRVYVSTATESVTRATDDAKQAEVNLFSNLHKLMFIPDRDLRDLVLGGLMAGLLAAASLGIVLFFFIRPKENRP